MSIVNFDLYKANKQLQHTTDNLSTELEVTKKFLMISGFIVSNKHLFKNLSYKQSSDGNRMSFYIETCKCLGHIELCIMNIDKFFVSLKKVTFHGQKESKELLFDDLKAPSSLPTDEKTFLDVDLVINTFFNMFDFDEKTAIQV